MNIVYRYNNTIEINWISNMSTQHVMEVFVIMVNAIIDFVKSYLLSD